MRYGYLDRQIDIQRKTVTLSPSGQPVETWANLVARLSARLVQPSAGGERFNDPQLAARQTRVFEIRHAPVVADVSPLDRVVYPSVAAGEPPEGSIHDIVHVDEIGRREGLRIVARRRADV